MSDKRMEQSIGLQGGHRFVGRLAGKQLECSAMESSARWHQDVEENVYREVGKDLEDAYGGCEAWANYWEWVGFRKVRK